ncbi:MAG TPA: DUF2934 domain-containing protein [Acetobacteraceae bacterium]|nr:DUF2934 domain-containing protein [Acetobacteraceae bacterium]
MSDNREQMIRERAHSLWEADGRPEGREQEYWLRAEQLLAEEHDPERPDMNKGPV